MAVCKYSKCEFVVYTLKDMKVIEIKFDHSFWEVLYAKLKTFYRKCYPCFEIFVFELLPLWRTKWLTSNAIATESTRNLMIIFLQFIDI